MTQLMVRTMTKVQVHLAITYTGIEGLTVKLGSGSDQSNSTVGVTADYTTMSAYLMLTDPFTACEYQASEYDHTSPASKDQEVTSWGFIIHSVMMIFRVSYGQETIENGRSQ